MDRRERTCTGYRAEPLVRTRQPVRLGASFDATLRGYQEDLCRDKESAEGEENLRRVQAERSGAGHSHLSWPGEGRLQDLRAFYEGESRGRSAQGVRVPPVTGNI